MTENRESRIVATKEEVAAYVGKSWRTVYRWIKEGMPVLPNGSFDLDQVDEWIRRRKGVGSSDSAGEGAGKKNGTEDSHDNKDLWDKESKKWQAKTRELEFRKRQGELIEWSLIENIFVARALEVRALLLSLERILPPDLIHCRTDREMSELVRKYTRRALTQFCRPLPITTRGSGGPDGDH